MTISLERRGYMKYYCVKQHDITDCGAACLATISKQFGLNLSISKIREIAGTDKQGTNAYGMIKAAEQLGFTAKGVKGDQEAFFMYCSIIKKQFFSLALLSAILNLTITQCT